MPVSCSRGASLAVLDGPVGLVSEGEEVELIEAIVSQLSAPQGSSEDEEKVVDGE